MKLYISSKKNLTVCILYFLYLIIILSYISNSSITTMAQCLNELNEIILLGIIAQGIAGILVFQQISYSIIFIFCCYLFTLSQNYLLKIGYDYGVLTWQIAYIKFGVSSYIKAMIYVVQAIQVLFGGILLGKTVYFHETKSIIKDRNTPKITYVKTLLGFTFFVDAYYSLYRIYVCLSQGYMVSHETVGNTYFTEAIVNLFPIAFYLYLVCVKDNIRKARSSLVIFIIYEIVSMLGGQRAHYTIIIISTILIYFQVVEKIKVRYILLFFILGVLFLQVLIMIRNGRTTGIYVFSIANIKNTIYETMSEFGITAYPLTKGFYEIEKNAYGKSILTSFLAVIPGWSYIFGDRLLNTYYTHNALNLQGYGSSFLLDLYFDFGIVGGIIASGIYGFFIAIIDKRIILNFKRENYIDNCFLIFLINEILFTVRSYIFRLPRSCFYFMLTYWILNKIIENRRIKL